MFRRSSTSQRGARLPDLRHRVVHAAVIVLVGRVYQLGAIVRFEEHSTGWGLRGLGARFLCYVRPEMILLPLLAVLVQSLTGAPVDALQAPAGTKAIVFLFTSTDCPISNRYAPEVRRIADRFAAKGVVFRLVYPNPDETAAQITEHMSAFALRRRDEALRDPAHALVKAAGATVTPEAAVDAGGRSSIAGGSTIAMSSLASSGRPPRSTISPTRSPRCIAGNRSRSRRPRQSAVSSRISRDDRQT